MTGLEIKPLKDLRDPTRAISYGIVQPGRPAVGGVPIVRVNNFSRNGLDLSSVLRVEPTIEAQYRRSRPKPGDVLLTLVGSIGQVAIAPPEIEGWNLARAVGLIPTADEHHSQWIALCLRAPAAQAFIHRNANTTVQATFNLKDLALLPIPYPSKGIRDGILSALTPLDDKIELNRQMNETLEATAQAIFRDWFVDFGPVRRKLAGETDPVSVMGGLTSHHHCAAELAALFPSELPDDRPTGWQMSTLGETTTALLGGTPSRKVSGYWGGSVPWINSGEVNEFRITRPSEFISPDGFAKSATKLLPRRTTVLAITGATLGQVSLTEIATCANQSVVGLVPDGPLPAEFVYLSVKSCIDEIIGRQTGGAQQHINKGNVEEQSVLLPSSSVLDAWSEIAVPIFDRIAACCFESQTLVETRDYLLPRLMSGAVRVKEALEQDAAA
jgi:type I restriction enzyme S subunit